jgi:hypothetical protein
LITLMLGVASVSVAQQGDEPKEVTEFRVRVTDPISQDLEERRTTRIAASTRGSDRARELSVASGVSLVHVRSSEDGTHVVRHPTALTRAEAWDLAIKIRMSSGAALVEPIDPSFRKRPPAMPTLTGK